MRPPSLGQARSCADTLFSAGMVLVEASEGVRSFCASPRAVSRIAVSILAKDHQVGTRASTYWIAIRDFYSLVQTATHNLVIVALSVLSGIANHEMFLNGSGPINGLIALGG